jgi:hypothetical protein
VGDDTVSSGKNLLNAYLVLETAGSEIEALITSIAEEFKGADEKLMFDDDEEVTDEDAYHTGDYWICSGWHWRYPVKKKGKGPRRVVGKLHVVVDLGAPDRPARSLGFPVLQVCWAGRDESWDELDDDPDWPFAEGDFEIRASRLLWYKGDEDKPKAVQSYLSREAIDAAWMYLVPLLSVRSPKDVRRIVVEPVIALLNGRSAVGVFADASEVVQLEWEDGEARAVKER